MPKETDMSFFIEKSGMFFLIHSAVFSCFTDISIKDNFSIERYFNIVAISDYFLIIPFSYRF